MAECSVTVDTKCVQLANWTGALDHPGANHTFCLDKSERHFQQVHPCSQENWTGEIGLGVCQEGDLSINESTHATLEMLLLSLASTFCCTLTTEASSCCIGATGCAC